MWAFLSRINKNLVKVIPLIMLLGFLYGILMPSAFLKNLIVPFTFLMVYPMMVTLKIRKVFEGGDIKAQLLTQIINFGIVPFAAFGLGLFFFRDQPYMALGLLLAGLVPTSGMTISWTGFAKGNMEAAVKMTVIGLTLGSLATPFYVKFFMGAELDVNPAAVMKQIVIIVFIPMIAGYITQQVLIRRFGMEDFQQRWAPRFPGISTLGVIGIVFIAIALKAGAVASSPGILFYILVPLSLLYTCNYIFSTLVGKMLLPRADAIALVYGSVMRNLSIALAIAINTFGAKGSDTALVIAIAYIIQVQSAAWYVKLTDRLFGQIPEEIIPESEAETMQEKQERTEEKNMVPDIRKILLATDLSATARHAARYACSIGHKYGASVTVLHVVPDILEEFSSGAGINLLEHMEEKQWKNFNEKGIRKAAAVIRKRIAETSRKVLEEIPKCPVTEDNVRVEVGDPVKSIVSIAENEDYDLVIMGTNGHGKLEEFMIGSISAGVIRQCRKPVLTALLPA